jgi:rhodanese-related sulfurtransferase
MPAISCAAIQIFQMDNKQNQNRIFIVGFVLITLVIVWFLAKPVVLKLAGKSENSEEKINAEILKASSISVQNLFKKMENKENIIIADLRGEEEFNKGHIVASQRYSAEELNAKKIESLGADKTASLVLVNSGDDIYETARKVNELAAAGFVNAKYLAGGIDSWKSQGFPLISGGGLQEDKGKVKKISLDELIDDLNIEGNLIQFLDIRSAADFAAGHISGALSIPLVNLEKDQGKLSPIKKIILYGASEEEAARAAASLFDLNLYNVWVLDGGLEAWKNAGGKTDIGG